MVLPQGVHSPTVSLDSPYTNLAIVQATHYLFLLNRSPSEEAPFIMLDLARKLLLGSLESRKTSVLHLCTSSSRHFSGCQLFRSLISMYTTFNQFPGASQFSGVKYGDYIAAIMTLRSGSPPEGMIRVCKARSQFSSYP